MIWTCSSFFVVFVLSYYKCVFAFRVPCCDVCYDFSMKTMFGSSLPLVVCGWAHVLFASVVFVWAKWCPTHIVLCFLLCSSSPCVSYVVSFPALSICDCPALFFNVYLGKCKYDHHTWIISAISFYLVETKVCNVLILFYYSYQKLLQCRVLKGYILFIVCLNQPIKS
jgi:hypothetical protein